MNDKKIVKWATRIVPVACALEIGGSLLYVGIHASKKEEKLRNEITRIENPVLVINQDETLVYQGTGKDRSRNLLPAGEYRYFHVIPDLDNSEKPYVEVRNFGMAEFREATLHIGRNQPLPMYESLGNGGCFDW